MVEQSQDAVVEKFNRGLVCKSARLVRSVPRLEASEVFEEPYQNPIARSFDAIAEEYNRRHPEEPINRMTAFKTYHKAKAKLVAALLGGKPATRNRISMLFAD